MQAGQHTPPNADAHRANPRQPFRFQQGTDSLMRYRDPAAFRAQRIAQIEAHIARQKSAGTLSPARRAYLERKIALLRA
ncbi:hypothetical protein BXY66_3868 [Shimia isoporae]|uniref:Uncharacterized protein n=1 Tax=Shimia isoporae TaxID=647720 RepID=A0A4R1N0H1_9RHOB|nr:hypothetical protein [Shimia isoporae]TCK99366.1 hypothetical protein BXY66_3868 [Shimia isoporae]